MPIDPTEKDPDDTSDKPPFRESAEVLLAMWSAGEYPNPSDAVQDCKALLYAVPPEHASYRPQLEAILQEAIAKAAELAAARAAMPDPPSMPRLPTPKRASAVPATPPKTLPAPAKKKASPVKKKAAAKKAAAKKAAAKKAPAKKAPAKKAPAKKAKKGPAKKAAPKSKGAKKAKRSK
jgi:hypothetical protein